MNIHYKLYRWATNYDTDVSVEIKLSYQAEKQNIRAFVPHVTMRRRTTSRLFKSPGPRSGTKPVHRAAAPGFKLTTVKPSNKLRK